MMTEGIHAYVYEMTSGMKLNDLLFLEVKIEKIAALEGSMFFHE